MAYSHVKYNILDMLRTSKELVPYMSQDGTIDTKILKKVTGIDFEYTDIVDDRYISGVCNNDDSSFIRAIFGHKSPILDKMNYGKYVKYAGRYKVFCITHTCLDGLGSVNYNRKFNILNIPERCENKGVKAYINVENARKKGLEFWSPVGDRYQNKIFCFDVELRDEVFYTEYVADYTSPERLKNTHVNIINAIKNFGVDEDVALKRVQNMIILDEVNDEVNDDSEDIDTRIRAIKL